MRIGETIATYDIGLALRGKSGKFEVTSPAGDVYDIFCKPNHSLSGLEWSSNETDNPPFFIRRVAEGSSPAATKETTVTALEEESQSAASPLPFVLDHSAGDGWVPSTANIELSYIEEDPETGEPSACIYLKNQLLGHALKAEPTLTSRCGTLNQLDSEIRRIEAQLDEIRSRAKKMFYKTQAVAASA